MDDILKRVGAYISDTHMLARGAMLLPEFREVQIPCAFFLCFCL